jgi:calcium permeable stress-gated cation channel
MPQTGENDEEIGAEDSDDFGGDQSPVDPEDTEAAEKKKRSAEKAVKPTIEPGNRIGHAAPGEIQHNQGPGPSAEYGDSVPVEGKRNEGPTDFNHPASVEPQRIVWLPQDPLGISDVEVRELNGHGVEASNENATISVGGTVDVQSHPPGMDPNTIFG